MPPDHTAVANNGASQTELRGTPKTEHKPTLERRTRVLSGIRVFFGYFIDKKFLFLNKGSPRQNKCQPSRTHRTAAAHTKVFQSRLSQRTHHPQRSNRVSKWIQLDLFTGEPIAPVDSKAEKQQISKRKKICERERKIPLYHSGYIGFFALKIIVVACIFV